jgi:hypothetical protein
MKRFKYLILLIFSLVSVLLTFSVSANNNLILWRISFFSPNNNTTVEFCVLHFSIRPNPYYPPGYPYNITLYRINVPPFETHVDPSTIQFIGTCEMPPPPDGVTPEDWNDLTNWDFDGDGIPNGDDSTPYGSDLNNNGVPDAFEDLDGDGLPDGGPPGYRGPRDGDADGDGIPDSLDPDDDNDGIPDGSDPTPGGGDDDGGGEEEECEPDKNGDGTPDDEDGDGTPDCEEEECEPDKNGDGTPDDEDGDGTPDCEEEEEEEECEPDKNGDGTPDDEDGDGTPDCEEKDDCPFDGSQAGFLDAFVSFLPSSPESIRIPVIISRIAGGNTLAGNFLLVMWEGVYQLFLVLALVKFYKLLPFT